MRAVIFIHYHGEIVRKFVLVIESLDELKDLYEEMNTEYGGDPDYCFDVMICPLVN